MHVQLLKTIAIICAAHIVASAQQDAGCEQKAAELERRVRVLEQQLGISSSSTWGVSTSKNSQASAQKVPAQAAPAYSAESPAKAVVKSTAKSKMPIAVQLIEKSLQEKGPGEETDRLGFEFEFQNVGNEHITSFNGDIDLRDPDGVVMQTFPFDMATYIQTGEKTAWYASIPFSNVNGAHRKLYSTDAAALDVVLKLKQVMYYDTRVETFD